MRGGRIHAGSLFFRHELYINSLHECACARAPPRKSAIEMWKTENRTDNRTENGTDNAGIWKMERKVAWRLPATVDPGGGSSAFSLASE